MSDAINAVTGEYETYAAEVDVPADTSATAAGAAAAHRVLTTLFDGSHGNHDGFADMKATKFWSSRKPRWLRWHEGHEDCYRDV